ncbi:unnamed protein product, partial [marine sediment metagenome]
EIREMIKKGSNFFEEHIEKIVLAIVGLICLWLLITRVFLSPNVVSYDNRKFGPVDIDTHIGEQAELLEDKLNDKPEPGQPYKKQVDGLIALLNSAIDNIDTTLYPPIPPNTLIDVGDNPAYRIPQIGEVNDVVVERIRAAAYVPTEEIDEENVYDSTNSEPNDIDFVTVEAKFDVARLMRSFYGSFAGEDVPEEWRDPCLANPAFAAVQLQRQELLADGSWSDWQIVPRTKIDHRRKMFEAMEKVEKLPLVGIKA